MNPEEHNEEPSTDLTNPVPQEPAVETPPEEEMKPDLSLAPETPIEANAFESAQGLNPPQKKSHKKLIVIASLIVAAIIGASVGAYLFTMKKTAAPDTTHSTTQATTTSKNSVDAATKSLTDGANDETTLTNTDDSSYGTDASTTAGTVGDSVDENSF